MSSPTDDISKPVNSPEIGADAPNWFQVIKQGVNTSLTGLGLTWDHLWAARNHRAPIGIADPKYFEEPDGIFTLDYPFEGIAVPEVGRYQLHNEIEDCIVCDKCAKICPVDCIEIEVIKSPEVTGYTSDGTAKRLYAERFDIDMAKCCFCGLCTNVCPTDCLTMGNEIDVVTPVMADLTKAFGNLSPDEAIAKKALYDTYLEEKEAAKRPVPKAEPILPTDLSVLPAEPVVSKAPAKPWLKPSTATTPPPPIEAGTPADPTLPIEAPKPKAAVAKPWLKSSTATPPPIEAGTPADPTLPIETPKPKAAVAKPWLKPSTATPPPPSMEAVAPISSTEPAEAPKAKAAVAKPWLKAKVKPENPAENSVENTEGGDKP
jgi:NADH-quinone oxidoreductase subunit I